MTRGKHYVKCRRRSRSILYNNKGIIQIWSLYTLCYYGNQTAATGVHRSGRGRQHTLKWSESCLMSVSPTAVHDVCVCPVAIILRQQRQRLASWSPINYLIPSHHRLSPSTTQKPQKGVPLLISFELLRPPPADPLVIPSNILAILFITFASERGFGLVHIGQGKPEGCTTVGGGHRVP
jgi:hypothetical protein